MNKKKLSDDRIRDLMKQLGIRMRRDAAKGLLAGNDMGCFSTKRYETAYVLRSCRGRVPVGVEHEKEFLSKLLGEDWARQMLLSISDTVKEVKPDVWTYA